MMKFEAVLQKLRSGGFRLTRARRSIIRIFLDSGAPLSAAEVMALLLKVNVKVNKTTVYREIDFLMSQDMLLELHLGDGRKRYEIMKDDHHHHLFCVNCSGVECVELERCLEAEEKRISEEKNFRIIKHSVDFYGICAECE
jgi:Fe2+ or Zn2+ uptake regulation protein